MIKEVATTLNQFFNSFGVPAYITNFAYTASANESEYLPAEMPYITYDAYIGSTLQTVPVGVRIWYSAQTIQTEMYEIADKILGRIKGGLQVPCGNGYLYIYPGNPYAQPAASENPSVCVMYLNINVSYDLN